MVRNIDGQGRLMQRYPAALPGSISWPLSSTIDAEIPGKGTVAEPGMVVVMPGKRSDENATGLRLPPSVDDWTAIPCPITSLYQIQASGLIGSPTRPHQIGLTTDRAWPDTRRPTS